MRHALLLALALAALNLPPWGEALQFDRSAIAGGELWRLVTGNLVHYSAGHLAMDLCVVLVAGAMLGRRAWAVAPAAAIAVGLGLWAFCPEVEIYRGLSGVSVAMAAAAVLAEIVETRHPAFVLIGLGLVAKLAVECATGRFIGTSIGEMGLPIPAAHVFGAAAGVAVGLVRRGPLRKGAEARSFRLRVGPHGPSE